MCRAKARRPSRLEAALPAGVNGELTPADLRSVPAPVREAFERASVGGLHALLLGAMALAATAFAVAWLIRETPLRGDAPTRYEDG
ncbi:hypothetical protein [Streptomyces sp. NBC_00096]|uniref:hypothetical protein n=1 Tax=Streptomyces sp. NBC_00096 TaxID=2975650 RepID=UPI00324616E7